MHFSVKAAFLLYFLSVFRAAAPVFLKVYQAAMQLSVIIITHNEAQNIAECLGSVSFADEWIVLDSGSTDDTREIARGLGARVAVSDGWPGFGPQKNAALDLATGDWVLSLDADERVTPELAQEIRAVMTDPQGLDAYDMPRLSSFCGKFLRHGWYPDRVLRLFRRGQARFSDDQVHERVITAGPHGQLGNHLLHYTYPDLDSAIAKMNRYSTDSARMLKVRGRKASIGTAIGHGLWTFIRIYVFKRAFLDGKHGFVMAVTHAAGSFYRYAKIALEP